MEKLIHPVRIIAFFVMFALVLGLYGTTMYDLQVVQGNDYYALATGTTTTSTTVSAARGAIMDRNGTLLVSSVTSYNIGLNRSELMSADHPNDVILQMIYFAIEHGVSYTDTMPVTISPPFSYTSMNIIQDYRYNEYLKYMELDPNISASDFIVWLKDHYGIDYTTSVKDARLIIGMRYELEIRLILNVNPYLYVEDASAEFVAALLEMNFPGVRVEKTTKRQYHTRYGAHLLGYIGYMNEEEYERYRELGYGMNTRIGKEGVEAAFEEYLHGTDGLTETTWNEDGEIIDIETVTEAMAGSNIYLTMDIGLQGAAENALATTIAAINANLKPEDSRATGGSAVAIDVATGGVLACASYPTYDITTFLDNFDRLANDPTNPLFNRATMGTYNPGSTFKLVTALTALRNGVIDVDTKITCTGIYDKYKDYDLLLYCWVYPDTHGSINVVQALGESCNFFFYTVGLESGPTAIAATAQEFGLGDPTGVEIAEIAGNRATIAYKQETVGLEWYDADTLMDAIGQSFNYYTTIQLANYAATIGSGGIHRELSLLDLVVSPNFTTVLLERTPVVRNVIDNSQGYLNVLRQGMRLSATEGTGSTVFSDYKVPVATKTGTTQSDATSTNSGIFLCLAPADDPQIAIAVTVENGKSGASIMTVAKEMLDYYFSGSYSQEYLYENQLIT